MSSSITRRTAMAVSATVALVCAGGATSSASSPHLVPADTVVTGSLKSGTSLNFDLTLDGFTDDVMCTGFSTRGTTPKDGLTVALTKRPVFEECLDTVGGTDPIVSSGKFTLTSDEAGKVVMHVPDKGLHFSSQLISGCTLIFGPGTIPGTLPVAATGCTASPTVRTTPTAVWTPDIKVAG